jgi:branched-chain amino acid transport system permease protein
MRVRRTSRRGGHRSPRMTVDWRRSTRLLPSRRSRVVALACVLAWLVLPMSQSDETLTVLGYAGIAATGALGLNLLTGYAGQLSLGHAFSFGAGAYATVLLATHAGLPIEVWLPGTALIGALIGAAVGPIALRVRGDYLAICTIALVFVGQYLFQQWGSLTGGTSGTSVLRAVPAFDTPTFTLFGSTYSRAQGLFWLIWAIVAFGALLVRNLIRSRPGRAMQAVRDHDLAAEALGVSLPRYTIGAFAIAGAYAAIAGAMYGLLQVAVQPSDFDLTLSVEYVAMILIGGLGSITGSLIGALIIGSLPQIIENFTATHTVPLVPAGALDPMIFGALIVLFVLIAPNGLTAWISRIGRSISAWPLPRDGRSFVNEETEEW